MLLIKNMGTIANLRACQLMSVNMSLTDHTNSARPCILGLYICARICSTLTDVPACHHEHTETSCSTVTLQKLPKPGTARATRASLPCILTLQADAASPMIDLLATLDFELSAAASLASETSKQAMSQVARFTQNSASWRHSVAFPSV